MFYVMKSDSAYVAGAYNISTASTLKEAEKKARDFDTRLNGQRMGKTWVMNQEEHNEWHNNNVMPLYNRR